MSRLVGGHLWMVLLHALDGGLFLYRVCGSAGLCRQPYGNESQSGADQDFRSQAPASHTQAFRFLAQHSGSMAALDRCQTDCRCY